VDFLFAGLLGFFLFLRFEANFLFARFGAELGLSFAPMLSVSRRGILTSS
jgi:hypothetical protein